MNAEPVTPAFQEAFSERDIPQSSASKQMALENQAELKRLIEETCRSISNSQELIQQIKQERGV
jgi:hypothetical protein